MNKSIKAGVKFDNNLGTFEYEKYDTKEAAVDFIRNRVGLELKKNI